MWPLKIDGTHVLHIIKKYIIISGKIERDIQLHVNILIIYILKFSFNIIKYVILFYFNAD